MSQPIQPSQPQQYGPLGQTIPPKRKKWPWIVLAAVLLSVLIGFVACGAMLGAVDEALTETTAEPADAPAPTDSNKPSAKPSQKPFTAKVTKCEKSTDEFSINDVDVVVRIKNNTAETHTYYFDLLLLDEDDNTIGDGFSGEVQVKPGKSANKTVYADLNDNAYKGKVRCEVKVTDW